MDRIKVAIVALEQCAQTYEELSQLNADGTMQKAVAITFRRAAEIVRECAGADTGDPVVDIATRRRRRTALPTNAGTGEMDIPASLDRRASVERGEENV